VEPPAAGKVVCRTWSLGSTLLNGTKCGLGQSAILAVGTIVEMRSVSIARKWIGLGCVTDMERLSAVTVVR